jgi:hypothetical protein
MKITAEVSIVEVNGRDAVPGYTETMHLERHWNVGERLIVVQLPDGKKFTVPAGELKAAILSCTGMVGY